MSLDNPTLEKRIKDALRIFGPLSSRALSEKLSMNEPKDLERVRRAIRRLQEKYEIGLAKPEGYRIIE